MNKFAFNPEKEKSARVYGRGLAISRKSSVLVCKKVTGMRSDKAKQLLNNMINQKQSLDGKFYTNISKEMISLINSAEKNAEDKGLDTEKLHIHASAHKGFGFFKPRGWKRKKKKKKTANLQIVLVQR